MENSPKSMKHENKYSLKERAEFWVDIAKKGKNADGSKMSESRKNSLKMKSAKLHDRAVRVAKNFERYGKDN